MNTRTYTNTYVNEDILAAAEEATANLTAARETYDRRSNEYAQSSHLLDSLNARIDGGDDTVSSIDLLTAEREVARAKTLLDAAIEELAKRTRYADFYCAQANPWLAEEVAEHIRENAPALGVRGLSVYVVNSFPIETEDAPCVFVRAIAQPQENVAIGTFTGGVEVCLFGSERDPFHTTPNLKAAFAKVLGKALRASSPHIGPSANSGKLYAAKAPATAFSLDFTNAVAKTPRITKGAVDAKRAGDSVARLLVNTLATRREFTEIGNTRSEIGVLLSTLSTYDAQAKVASQSARGGELSTTLAVSVELSDKYHTVSELSNAIQRLSPELVGGFIAGAGRIESVSVDRIIPTNTRVVAVELSVKLAAIAA